MISQEYKDQYPWHCEYSFPLTPIPGISSYYLYQPFEDRKIESLLHRTIRISNPRQFNDPFDCWINVELNWESDAECELFLEKLAKNFRQNGKLVFPKTIKPEYSSKFFKNFKPLFEEMLKTYGIICFSDSSDKTLMWSHYAKDHKGFCLGFDAEKLLKLNEKETPSSTFYPINYMGCKSLSIQEIFSDDLTMLTKEFFGAAYANKISDWHYEREWRILFNDSTKAGTVVSYEDLNLELTEIIFGLKMPVWQRHTMVWQLSKNGPLPEIYHSVWNEEEQKLDRILMSDQELNLILDKGRD